MTPSYDQARQFGKTYVGALNTGPDAFASLFAPDADVRMRGADSSPDAVRDASAPGRSAFRGARVEAEHVVLVVRVIDRAAERVDDRSHRLLLDDAGRIVALEA